MAVSNIYFFCLLGGGGKEGCVQGGLGGGLVSKWGLKPEEEWSRGGGTGAPSLQGSGG